MTTGFIMYTLICVISKEFLSLSHRRSSVQNVPSSEKQGEKKQMFLRATFLKTGPSSSKEG